ncbi:hypothetical protein ACX9R5_00310 [Rathayibacter sp. CAU 1779]
MTDLPTEDTTRRRPDGPPAGVLGIIVLAFTIASVVAYALDSGFWTGFFTFAASIPLGIYAATVYARQLRLGIRVPGPGISFFGGVSASVLLGLSGLLGWAQAQVSALPASVTKLLTETVFVLGGVGFVCGLGLLIAGIAVPAVILRLVPRWLGWVGLVLGALGEIAFLALLWDGLDVLLPIVRFGGLIWLAVIGFLLPRNRHDVDRSARR